MSDARKPGSIETRGTLEGVRLRFVPGDTEKDGPGLEALIAWDSWDLLLAGVAAERPQEEAQEPAF